MGEEYLGMFDIGISYILASRASSTDVWGVDANGIITEYAPKKTLGVRPILSLKTTTRTTGYDRHGVWELEADEKVVATLDGSTRKELTVGKVYGDLGTKTKTGYTFQGWYTKENGQGTQITSNTVVTEKKNHTLYPYYKPVSVTVTFDANGGTVSQSTKTVEYGGTYGELPTPTLANMVFVGWYTAKTSGTKILPTSISRNTKATTLYAHWSTSIIDVTLDPNGGTVSPDKITVSATGTYGTLPTPERVGYTFGGWYTAKSGGTVMTATKKVDASYTTLYAHWTAKTDTKYTVYHCFENLDGEYTTYKTEENTGTTGATVTLKSLTTTITGGTYKKGSITPNGASTTSTTILADGSRTIYLYYSRNSYVLTLAKGNNITAVTGAGTYKYGQEVSIDATVADKTSNYRYVFEKWTASTVLELSNAKSKKTTFTMPASAVTLTASATQEEIISVIVHFDPEGGIVTPTQKEVIYGETYGELPTPVRDGYKFVRWYNGSYGTVIENTGVTNAKEHTLFAEWQEITYTITINQVGKANVYHKDSSNRWMYVNYVYVSEGGTAEFKINASKGYAIKSVIYDGKEWALNSSKTTLTFALTNVNENHTISVRVEEMCGCSRCDTGFATDHECSNTTCTECDNCDTHYNLCSECGNCFIHCDCESGSSGGDDDKETCSRCNGTGYSCGYYLNSTPIKCSSCGKKTLIKQGCSTHMWADSKCSGCGVSFRTSPWEQGCVTCGFCGGTGKV